MAIRQKRDVSISSGARESARSTASVVDPRTLRRIARVIRENVSLLTHAPSRAASEKMARYLEERAAELEESFDSVLATI